MTGSVNEGRAAEDKFLSNQGSKLLLATAVSVASHPLSYVKVLMQVGHEPISPLPTRTFFGKTVYCLPNFFQYAGHIKKVDGWFGLYRGLGPRIVFNVVNTTVRNAVASKLPEASNKIDKSFTEVLQETGNEAITKTAALVVSYPFHLITVRMMVQFVGREEIYKNVFVSMKEIYYEEGILGFFRGFIPHLIGELCLLWLCKSINFSLYKYILPEEYAKDPDTRTYSEGVSSLAANQIIYPFQLVSNLMAVNDTRLLAGSPPLMPIYASWTDCWIQLGKQGLRNRGSSLFRRTLRTLPSTNM